VESLDKAAECLSFVDLIPKHSRQPLLQMSLRHHAPETIYRDENKLSKLDVTYNQFKELPDTKAILRSATNLCPRSVSKKEVLSEVLPFFARMYNCDKYNLAHSEKRSARYT
jgi:hypothetical protein